MEYFFIWEDKMKKLTLLLTSALAAFGLTLGASAYAADQENELEIFSWWAGDEGPALEALIKLYNEKYPDTKLINATVTGGSGVNAKAVLKTRMLGGEPPDSFQVHAGQEIDRYMGQIGSHGRSDTFV